MGLSQEEHPNKYQEIVEGLKNNSFNSKNTIPAYLILNKYLKN